MGLKRFEMICLFCLNDNQHLLISGTRRLHHSIKPNKKGKVPQWLVVYVLYVY